MTAEEVHREIVARLLSLREGPNPVVARVRVLSRLYREDLLGGDATSRVFAFFPDLHLMSREGDADYRYGFRRLDPARWVRRGRLLDEVGRVLIEFWNGLPAGRTLRAVQLGDFLDLWRESERGTASTEEVVRRILDHNPEARRRLVRRGPESLEPDVVLGNHDRRMNESAELRSARRAFAYRVGAEWSLLATHGDAFDPIEERLPDKLKEQMVEWFGPLADGGRYVVDRTGERRPGHPFGSQGEAPITLDSPDDALQLPDWVNVWAVGSSSSEDDVTGCHELLPWALRSAAGVRSGDAAALAKLGLAQGLPALRAIVIGHSHHPRICIYRDPRDSSANLVLMDCGAWIEESVFEDATVPSCHLGVLVGGDARIYQLDPHGSLVSDAPPPP